MELLLFIVAIVIVFIVWKSRANPAVVRVSTKKNSRKHSDDYEIWLSVFKEEKSNIKEFDLFGTKAAVAWNEGDNEITVICITAFQNQQPITKKWDHFEFNIEEKYWTGATPKGSPARIREELKCLGLI